jgi:NADH:ubiquinone oxidoreductase subunit F (NADH-binding)/ferredoxin
MAQRPDIAEGVLRVRVDASRCDGQGVCALIAPAVFHRDRYGDAYIAPDAHAQMDIDADLRRAVVEAAELCPRAAISVQAPPHPPPAPVVPQPSVRSSIEVTGSPYRLSLSGAADENLASWQALGGFATINGSVLLGEVERAHLHGSGGAGFPVASKWRSVSGSNSVVVVNGAEREPGTRKDRYLMVRRPHLVLDGLRLTMIAVGSRRGVIAIDEDSSDAATSIGRAIAEEVEAGLWPDTEIEARSVPPMYVAGEETALLSALEGRPALPRARPPYPSEVGLFGLPTVVHNVETLGNVALVAARGSAWYLEVGSETEPGTGLFSVGAFGGPFSIEERAIGYRLRDLLAEAGLLDRTIAAIVGGWSGGLVPAAAFDVTLSRSGLGAIGASLGTKSVQVVTREQCIVALVAEIVRFFANETANQCRPCFRGLPDVATVFERLAAGTGAEDELRDAIGFTSTLAGRGICRLPDGAARVVASLLRHFADDVDAHLPARTGASCTSDRCAVR